MMLTSALWGPFRDCHTEEGASLQSVGCGAEYTVLQSIGHWVQQSAGTGKVSGTQLEVEEKINVSMLHVAL